MRKLADLKSDVSDALTSANDVINLVATDPDWRGLEGFLGPVRAAKSKVEQGKIRNGFWKSWTHDLNFAPNKQFSAETLKKEMSDGYVSMCESVGQLKTKIEKLKRMQLDWAESK